MKRFADVLLLAALVLACGLALDRGPTLNQALLFAGLQLASLGGVAVAARRLLRDQSSGKRLVLALAGVVAWRLSYFPIMVFSGHVASIGEWIQIAVGIPPLVYPVFLASTAVLHAAVITAAGLALLKPVPLARWVVAGGFVFASLISFSNLEDLTLLPDRTVDLSDEVIPPLLEGKANPYLPAITAPGYAPNQRLMLVAAGLTYETIPDAPWARAVRDALEQSFHANPIGSTRDRVREHYLAYHTAQPRLSSAERSDP